jgi:hypothetical protein
MIARCHLLQVRLEVGREGRHRSSRRVKTRRIIRISIDRDTLLFRGRKFFENRSGSFNSVVSRGL